jgi:hypothetical protein
MELFLSGAQSTDFHQTSGENSLGGYKSSTKLPNGRVDFLFDLISETAKFNGRVDNKAVFLKNTSGQDVSNVQLYYIYDDNNIATFKVAAVEAVDNNKIEKIQNSSDSPFDAIFAKALSARAKTTVKVLSLPTIGEQIVIQGTINIVAESTNISSLIDQIVEASEDATFFATKVSDSEFVLKRNQVGTFTESFIYQTNGSVVMTADNFNFGSDNRVTLVETLKNEECIGIWLQRTIPAQSISSDDGLIEQLSKTQNKKENLELCVSYT